MPGNLDPSINSDSTQRRLEVRNDTQEPKNIDFDDVFSVKAGKIDGSLDE